MNQSPSPSLSPTEFARRLAAILVPLCAVVAARFRLLGPVSLPLWNRLNRARQHIARLMARLEAGTLRPARLHPDRPRPDRVLPDVPRSPGPSHPPSPSLPSRRGWLVAALRHEGAAYRDQLERLLAEPGVARLLAISPGAARTLRPICRILGIDPPAPGPAANPVPEPRSGPDPEPPPSPALPPDRDRDPLAWLTARDLTTHFLKPA